MVVRGNGVDGERKGIETARSAKQGGGRSRARGAGSLLGPNDPSSITTNNAGYFFHLHKVTRIFCFPASVKAFLDADAGVAKVLGRRNKTEAALP